MSMCKTIIELSKALGFNKKEQESIKEHIDNHSLCRLLCVLRVKKDITIEDMAKKLNMPVWRIERLESTPNHRIKIKNLIEYTNALGYSLNIKVKSHGELKKKSNLTLQLDDFKF